MATSVNASALNGEGAKFICDHLRGSGWVELTNRKTGKTLRLYLAGLSVAATTRIDGWFGNFSKRLDARTATDLKWFKELVEYQLKRKPKAAPVPPVGTKAEIVAEGEKAEHERAYAAKMSCDAALERGNGHLTGLSVGPHGGLTTEPPTSPATPAPKPTTPEPEPASVKATRNRTAERVQNGITRKVKGTDPTPDGYVAQQLEQTVKESHLQYVSLEYDIPDTKLTEVPNPSGWMWAYGFRRQLSCWCMPEDNLRKTDVEEFIANCRHYGVTVDILRIHPEEQKLIREIARRKLAEHVSRLASSLQERIATAETALRELLEGDDTASATIAKGEKKRDDTHRNVVREIVADFNHAVECAALFDETEALAPLLDGLKAALKAEAAIANRRRVASGRYNVNPVRV